MFTGILHRSETDRQTDEQPPALGDGCTPHRNRRDNAKRDDGLGRDCWDNPNGQERCFLQL